MPAPVAVGILAGLKALGTKVLGAKAATALAGRLGGSAGIKALAGEAGKSGLINFGAGMAMDAVSGRPMDVGRNLQFALLDTALSGGAQTARRAMGKGPLKFSVDPKTGARTPVKRRGENLVNIGTSLVATPMVFEKLGGGQVYEGPAPTTSATSIDAQQVQRALINNDPRLLAGAYMNGTNFLDLNLPSQQAENRQYMNDLGVQIDPNMHRQAAAILGL